MADSLTPTPPSFLRRMAQAVQYTISGITPQTFMSPLNPLKPMAEGSKGRAFDYPVAVNLNYIPRGTEPLSFGKLKSLAETGIVRACIQTRLDQIESLDYVVRPKEVQKGKRAKSSQYAGKIQEINDWLKYPDGRNNWASWLHMIGEQHFVYDSVVLYKRPTRGGKLSYREVQDGASFKVLVDADGRPHPPAPSPAYQQILKGFPASNYTSVVSAKDGPTYNTGEILYLTKNPRVDRLYGFPVTAQIMQHVELALYRTREQVAEYKDGNVPRGFIEGNPGMTTTDIEAMQSYWDSLFKGNIEMRRDAWWVPNGTKYTPMALAALFDAFDEWLARVVCYGFSLPPTPFIKQQTRAGQESAQEVASAEGLQPSIRFLSRMMNRILEVDFGAPELEFAFDEDAEFDPSARAIINNSNARAGISSLDEIREANGDDPLGGAFAIPMFATPNGYVPVDPVAAAALVAAANPAPELGKAPGAAGAPGSEPGKNPAPQAPNSAVAPGNAPKPPAGANGKAQKGANSVVGSLFIKRPLLNAHDLVAWAKSQGFAKTLLPEDMHVTQAFSRTALPWPEPGDAPHTLLVENGERSVAPLGLEGATVLHIESPHLTARFHELAANGASWDHAEYNPHVTISYEGSSKPLDEIEPYTGPLIFGPEEMKPVNEDWFAGVKEASVDVATGLTAYSERERQEALPGNVKAADVAAEEVQMGNSAHVDDGSATTVTIGNFDPRQEVREDPQYMQRAAHGAEVHAAALQADREPTPAQIAAGNYKHGHVTVQGLDITIENAQGSKRKGIGADGKPWSVVMPAHYGYIKRTTGADGDHVDVYLGNNPEAPKVWVIDQRDADSKEFDEHKCMIGFDTKDEALAIYRKGFSDGRADDRLGKITEMTMAAFKEWLKGDTTQEVGKAAGVPFHHGRGIEKARAKPARPKQHQPIPVRNPENEKAIAAYKRMMYPALLKLRASVVQQLRAKPWPAKKLAKADDEDDFDMTMAADLAEGLDMSALQVVITDASELDTTVAGNQSRMALAQLGFTTNDDLVNQIDQRAADWAEDRAAEMVGMRYDDLGNLVPSTNPEMAITDSTRNMVRDTIYDGLQNGLTADEITESLISGSASDTYPFSEERAALIAGTEIGNSHSAGALQGYKIAQGLGVNVKKEWDTSGEDTVCPDCQDNEDAGPIDLDDTFPSGDDAPLAHPGCNCVLVPFVDAGDGEEEDD